MKKILLLTMLFWASKVFSQQTFINYGKIEYESKINQHKQMDGDWAEEFKDKIPKFKTDYFNLYFKDNKTLFIKGRESDDKINMWDDQYFTQDITYTDLNSGTFVRKQQVFEQTYLLMDSIRNVQWRITNETREIAGFQCRKAVGRLLDSIYVVAFYSEEITVSGGPLSFNNLPGMILGLAIPRMGATIFATKLELVEPSPKDLTAPAKGKRINYKELQSVVKKTVSDWGSWGKRFMWQVML